MKTKDLHEIRKALEEKLCADKTKRQKKTTQKALGHIYMEIKNTEKIEMRFFNLNRQSTHERFKG